ncbi:hypothetical protein U1Q18_000111 [Sarracenia purpurea var. burkii]
MAFVHCIILFALSPLIFRQPHLAVVANDWLPQLECHNARVPETCIQCLNSDPSTGNANATGIATIVVGCVSTHADTLSEDMSQLADSKHDKVSAKVFKDCFRLIVSAKEELVAAGAKLKQGDYDGADQSVYGAFNYAVQCHSELDEALMKWKIDIPAEVQNKIKVHEELCEAAMRIIERL